VADRIWFVIAAAGQATRYGGPVPKPYLRIAGRTLLEHGLRTLGSVKGIAGGVVVLASGDRRFERLPLAVRRRVAAVAGGPTRAASVLHGLQALVTAKPGDWVLVHDAARPCLRRQDVEGLIAACRRDPVGGLLGVPVADTVKQADDRGRSARTLPRERLWRAQTPQMFRHGRLLAALTQALAAGFEPGDEAAAIENLGDAPLLVEGSPLNVKVTRPTDLAFAEAVLRKGRRRA
jgi:2-C-methyl-D-erythritol 4-phosphate cytidylyltransferase